MDPEPRGRGARRAAGKGDPTSYFLFPPVIDFGHLKQCFYCFSLCLIMPCCRLVARVTLVRCLKGRCSVIERQSPSKRVKKIYLRS